MVTIRDDPDPVWTHGSITYTLLVTNNGPLGSPEVTVVFNGVTFAGLQLVHLRSIQTSLGLCATALDSYVGIGRFFTLAEPLIATCDLGFLGPGNTAEVTVVIDVPIEREAGDTIGVASYILRSA